MQEKIQNLENLLLQFESESLALIKSYGGKMDENQMKLTDFMNLYKIQLKKELYDVNNEIVYVMNRCKMEAKRIDETKVTLERLENALKTHLKSKDFDDMLKSEEDEPNPLAVWKYDDSVKNTPQKEKIEVLSKTKLNNIKVTKRMISPEHVRSPILDRKRQAASKKELKLRPRAREFSPLNSSLITPTNIPFSVSKSRGSTVMNLYSSDSKHLKESLPNIY